MNVKALAVITFIMICVYKIIKYLNTIHIMKIILNSLKVTLLQLYLLYPAHLTKK